jgi:hypothetical protein
MPPSNPLTEAFETLIKEHQSFYGHMRLFYLHSQQFAASLYENEILPSVTDAYELIELETESKSEFIFDDWTITYDLLRELWTFEREIKIYDIQRESEFKSNRVKHELSKRIFSLGPRAFELLLFEIFSAVDEYNDPSIRQQSHDGGYEMFIRTKDPVTRSSCFILVQAKHQSKATSVSQVRELIGTLNVESNQHRDRTYRGLMVSIKPPTQMAMDAARLSTERIDFLTIDDLVELMVKYKIGWRSLELSFCSVDIEFWKEVSFEDA